MRQNFAQIRVMLDSPDECKSLSLIETWSLAAHEARMRATFARTMAR